MISGQCTHYQRSPCFGMRFVAGAGCRGFAHGPCPRNMCYTDGSKLSMGNGPLARWANVHAAGAASAILCGRVQEHRVQQSEHPRVEANPERQRHDCDDGQKRSTACRTNRIEEILPVNPHVGPPVRMWSSEFQRRRHLASCIVENQPFRSTANRCPWRYRVKGRPPKGYERFTRPKPAIPPVHHSASWANVGQRAPASAACVSDDDAVKYVSFRISVTGLCRWCSPGLTGTRRNTLWKPL